MFTRDGHAIVAAGADGGDVSGEDCGHAREPKSVGKGVGMAQLPAVSKRTIGSPGGLIRVGASQSAQDNMTKALTPMSCS